MIDLTGQIFNRLTVIKPLGKNSNRETIWECICLCGNTTESTRSSLKNGHKKSCGCLQKEAASKMRPIIHGETIGGKVSTEYKSWSHLKGRCNNPTDKRYSDYGGRGIRVCKGISESFQFFLDIMGRKESPELTIDRVINDLDYSCGKCIECIEKGWEFNLRWGTEEQQSTNRRSNVWYEYHGLKMLQRDWAKILIAHPANIIRSLKSGKSFDDIVEYYMTKKEVA